MDSYRTKEYEVAEKEFDEVTHQLINSPEFFNVSSEYRQLIIRAIQASNALGQYKGHIAVMEVIDNFKSR